MNESYTKEQIKGTVYVQEQLYAASVEHMGVSLVKDKDGAYHAEMKNPLVGLTAEQAAPFEGHDPLTEGEIADIRGMQRAKYPDDYMKFERTEITLTDTQTQHLEAIKNDYQAYSHTSEIFRKQAQADNDSYNKYAEEIALLAKASDQGYLNSLSTEERDAICAEYTRYVIDHKNGVIGYTDEELSKLTEVGREKACAESQKWTNEVMTDVSAKYPDMSLDNLAYPRSQYYECPFENFNAPDYTVAKNDTKSTVKSDSKDKAQTTESPFRRIAETAAAVFTAAKNYLKETKPGKYVVEKYNELFNKDKEVESTQLASTDKPADKSTQASTYRDTGEDIVDYGNSDTEAQYQS